MSRKRLKIAIFSYKAISNIFFSVSQPLIFLKCLCLSSRITGSDPVTFPGMGPLKGKYVSKKG